MTKNGKKSARASSSAKAAEILASKVGGLPGAASTAVPGFRFGASQLAAVAPTAPAPASATGASSTIQQEGGSTSSAEPLLSAGLDGQVAQHLRHLNKRDTVTKLKALQALKGMMVDRDSAELALTLQPWVWYYKKLVMDNSRTVRSEAQLVMAAMAAAAGKSLAVSLKSLIGPWWMAQFDPYQEAAANARAAFQGAFPERKQMDALLFCRVELVAYLADQLASTPQSLGDARKDSTDELGDRHQRVLSSSLLAAATLVEATARTLHSSKTDVREPTEGKESAYISQCRDLLDRLRELITAPGWLKKFLGAKEGQVRRGTYALVAAVAASAPEVLRPAAAAGVAAAGGAAGGGGAGGTKLLADTAPLVLGALGEQESNNHPAMWDMVLAFSKAYPEAWDLVNVGKAVLPKLWSMLRHGCYGSATSSLPMVQQLLDLLPEKVLAGHPTLGMQLLASCWTGCEQATTRVVKLAMSRCLGESVAWLLLNAPRLRPSENDQEGVAADYCRELLQDSFRLNVLPAALQPGAAMGDLALEALTSALAKLAPAAAQPREGGGSSQAEAAVHALCSTLGAEVHSAVTAALASGSAAGVEATAAGAGEGETSSSASLMRVQEVLLAITQAVPELRGQLALSVTSPLVAELMAAVQAGSSPAASRLLGTIVGELGAAPGAAAGEAAAGTAAASTTLDVAAVVSTMLAGSVQGPAAHANAQLLLSCLRASPVPAEAWGDLVLTVMGVTQKGDADAAVSEGLVLLSQDSSGRSLRLLALLVSELATSTSAVQLPSWHSNVIDALANQLAQPTQLLFREPAQQLLAELMGANSHGLCMLGPEAASGALRSLLQKLQDALPAATAPGEVLAAALSALRVLQPLLASQVAASLWRQQPPELVSAVACVFQLAWGAPEELRAAPAASPPAQAHAVAAEAEEEEESEDAEEDGEQAEDGYASDAEDGPIDTDTEQPGLHAVRAEAARLWQRGELLARLGKMLNSEVQSSAAEQLAGLVTQNVHRLAFGSSSTLTSGEAQAWAVRFAQVLSSCPDDSARQQLLDVLLAPENCWQGWSRGAQIAAGTVHADAPQRMPTKSHPMVLLLSSLVSSLGVEALLNHAPQASSNSGALSGAREWAAVELLCAVACGEADPQLQEAAKTLEAKLVQLAGGEGEAGPVFSEAVLALCLQGACAAPGASPYLQALSSLLGRVAGAAAHSSAHLSTLQHFFRLHVSSASEVPGHVLLEILPLVVPVFRSSQDVNLEECGVAPLTETLLSRSLSLDPVNPAATAAAVAALRTAVAAFPAPPEVAQPTVSNGGGWELRSGAATGREKAQLRALLKHQTVRHAAAAAAKRHGLDAVADPELQESAAAAVGDLILRALVYCWRDFESMEWHAVMQDIQQKAGKAAADMEAAVDALGAAMVAAAEQLLGSSASPRPTPAMAIQLMSTLTQKGLVNKHPAIGVLNEAVEELGTCAAAALPSLLSLRLLLVLDPQLRRVAVAPSGWHTFVRGAAALALRLLLAAGAVQAVAAAVPMATAERLLSWQNEQAALWSAAAAAAAPAAEQGDMAEAALLAADNRTVSSGSDGVQCLLALLLARGPHPQLQAAAWQLLLSPVVLPLLSFAAALPEGELPEFEGEEEAYLLKIGVRPEMLGPLLELEGTDANGPRCWALLLAHVLSLPASTQAPRSLCQALKEVDDLVPRLLDYVTQQLPLTSALSSRQRQRSSAAASTSASTAAAAANLNLADSLRRMGLTKGKAGSAALAAAVYRGVLRALPASARTWFGDLRDRGLAAAVEAYTAANESPALLMAEMDAVRAASSLNDDKFSVRANAQTREVVASLEVEDNSVLELVLRLPAATPLRAAEVECKKQVGVSEARLRKWLLSIASFMRNANASVADAISLWKSSLEREFAGTQPCLICYSVIAATNQQLPRLECRTCHVRFHSTCLYKWFKSSGKSNCPHCQSPW